MVTIIDAGEGLVDFGTDVAGGAAEVTTDAAGGLVGGIVDAGEGVAESVVGFVIPDSISFAVRLGTALAALWAVTRIVDIDLGVVSA